MQRIAALDRGGRDRQMTGYQGGYGLLGGLGIGIGMILWVVLIALVVWALLRPFGRRWPRPEESRTEIFGRRSDRGGIGEAKFEQV